MLELTRKICAAHGVSGYEKKAALKNIEDTFYMY